MMSKKKKHLVPTPVVQDVKAHKLAMRVIADEAVFHPDSYEFDDTFKPGNPSKFSSVHTVSEIMACLHENKDVDAEGIFLEADKAGNYRYRRINGKEKIKEAWARGSKLRKIREADTFATEGGATAGANAGLVGDDYVPLLGGPFNKQPYFYDYLRAHAYCFHEYHHHPLARAIVHITRDFVLGRGYRVDSDDPKALALWRAFEETNKLQEMMEDIVREGSIYGENMIWWLPNQETFIAYQVYPGQEPARGIIPRIRLIDPSTCWEIVTFPEDIKRVLYYQIVFPTQYQIYTGQDAGKPVTTSKFIMQQIPAMDVMHFKYNCVSNEKRGRSDLFPALGYLKWVRDCVNYKLIALKKQAAWTEDITVEGSQVDVDNLAASLQALGEFEPAGSRFLHTDKVTREYRANQGGSNGDDSTLEWGFSMVAAAVQIPISYFGLAKSAGQTRGAAIVGTEPVAKKFEHRQNQCKRILEALWRRFQDTYGVKGSDCTVTFPEIITQDRSAKLKDIKFIEDCGYISKETAGPLAAKEIDISNYDYALERRKIAAQKSQPIEPTIESPLTTPAAAPGMGIGQSTAGNPGKPPMATDGNASAMTSNERRQIKMRDTSSASNS